MEFNIRKGFDLRVFILIFIISNIIYFSLFCIANHAINNEMNNAEKISYNKLKKTLKSGDIICSRWNYIDTGYRIFSKYSHIGMVLNIDKKLYILETDPEESFLKDDDTLDVRKAGVHLYSLKERLDEYRGTCFVISYIGDVSQETINKKISENMKGYLEIPFDDNFRNTFLYNYFCKLFGFDVEECDKLFCSVFVSKLLYDTGILDHRFQCAEPGSFINYPGVYTDVKLIKL